MEKPALKPGYAQRERMCVRVGGRGGGGLEGDSDGSTVYMYMYVCVSVHGLVCNQPHAVRSTTLHRNAEG